MGPGHFGDIPRQHAGPEEAGGRLLGWAGGDGRKVEAEDEECKNGRAASPFFICCRIRPRLPMRMPQMHGAMGLKPSLPPAADMPQRDFRLESLTAQNYNYVLRQLPDGKGINRERHAACVHGQGRARPLLLTCRLLLAPPTCTLRRAVTAEPHAATAAAASRVPQAPPSSRRAATRRWSPSQ